MSAEGTDLYPLFHPITADLRQALPLPLASGFLGQVPFHFQESVPKASSGLIGRLATDSPRIVSALASQLSYNFLSAEHGVHPVHNLAALLSSSSGCPPWKEFSPRKQRLLSPVFPGSTPTLLRGSASFSKARMGQIPSQALCCVLQSSMLSDRTLYRKPDFPRGLIQIHTHDKRSLCTF